MSARAADEPLPGFSFRVSWADRQIASISSVSALRLDTGTGEQMQPGPVEFTRARTGDDAFEVWAADPAPQAVTVAVLDAGGADSLTFVLEDAVPVSYIALDGLDADSADTLRERLVVRCRAIRRVPTPATGGRPQELPPRPCGQSGRAEPSSRPGNYGPTNERPTTVFLYIGTSRRMSDSAAYRVDYLK